MATNDKAPNFKLPDSDGKVHSLSDYKNKYLVIYFYPRDDTPGCTLEAKDFNKYLDDIHKLGAEVVGISKDDEKSHKKFCDKYKLEFTLLSDPASETIKAYGAYGDRGIFGMGTIRKTFVIDKKGNIIKEFPKVKPLGHGKEIVDFLKEVK